ncbi:MAG: serine hydrolase [Planctomycetaceae bacterium]
MSSKSRIAIGIRNLMSRDGSSFVCSRRRRRQLCSSHASSEQLELRELLAGVVTSQSTFDLNQFAANIEEQAGGDSLQVEGYSYSATLRDPADPFEGSQAVLGAGGVARHLWDNNDVGITPATAVARQEIASVSKAFTGTAVLHAMQELTGSVAELSTRLDDPIVNYLPDSWATSASAAFSGISIRQLLTHTSGLRASTAATDSTPAFPGTVGGVTGGFSNSGYIYSDLQAMSQQGTVFSNARSYWTINYALFRVALPYMWAEDYDVGSGPSEPTFGDQLEAADAGQSINIDALPSGVWSQLQEDFGYTPADVGSGNTLLVGADELTASAYKTYIIQNVLPPTVSDLPTRTTANPTLLYQFPVADETPGVSTGDQTLNVGSRGMNLSVFQTREILTWLRHSDTVLSPETRGLMESQFLGFQPNFSGALGTYYGHDGINFRAQEPGQPQGTTEPQNNTVAISFPNGVEAAMFMNSQLGNSFGAAFDQNGAESSPARSLMDAYDNSWTHITYDGDPTSVPGGGTDDFTLRAGSNDSVNWIELDLNGTVVLERRIDTLQELRIRGLSGNDNLTIQSLPVGLDLDVIFEGGSGDDTLTMDTLVDGVNLDLTFLGSSGNDMATMSDLAKNVNVDFTFAGGSNDDTLILDTLGPTGSIDVEFQGGSGSDDVEINNLAAGAPLDLLFSGGSGGDSAAVNSLSSESEFTFNGGTGTDTVGVNGTTIGAIVTFNGGDDNDTALLGDGDLDEVRCTFLFVGGSGFDSLSVNDKDNSSIEQTRSGHDQDYTVLSTRIERSGIGVVGQFSQLENVRLDASDEDSRIRVLSTLGSTDLQLEGNAGDDLIALGTGTAGSQIDSNIDIGTGSGKDELVIDDRNSPGNGETYVLQGDYFVSAEIPVAEWDKTDPPETIRLRQRRAASETNIRDLLEEVRLEVEGGLGDDEIFVHASEPDSRMLLEGRGGDDVIILGEESSNVDTIEGEVRAFGGDQFDRVIVRDRAGGGSRGYRFIDRFVDLVDSPFGQLVVPDNEGTEVVEVQAGAEDDRFDVLTWMSAELHLNGGLGSDQLIVAATMKTVDPVLGNISFFADGAVQPGSGSPDFDTVVIHDSKRIGAPVYDAEVVSDLEASFATTDFEISHFGVEELSLKANKKANTVNVFGQTSLLHKADYVLGMSGGNDIINVDVPVTATVYANGGGGKDRVIVTGTVNDDAATLNGDRLDVRPFGSLPRTSVVRDRRIETLRFDAGAGDDVVYFEGVAGRRESIRVQATSTPGRGSIAARPFRSLLFEGLEDIDVAGNDRDQDRLQFIGTSASDAFSINPVGEGTTDQPFVQLTNNSGEQLLKLRDATAVGTPLVSGGSGDDTFRVTLLVNDDNPLRSVSLDGGKGKQDALIVSHNNSDFQLLSPAKSVKKGRLQFDADGEILDIFYRNFEGLVGDLF